MINISNVEEPLDLVKLSINEKVLVKCRGDREIEGTLIVSVVLKNNINLLEYNSKYCSNES